MPPDTKNARDIFVRNMLTGITVLASISVGGYPNRNFRIYNPVNGPGTLLPNGMFMEVRG